MAVSNYNLPGVSDGLPWYISRDTICDYLGDQVMGFLAQGVLMMSVEISASCCLVFTPFANSSCRDGQQEETQIPGRMRA